MDLLKLNKIILLLLLTLLLFSCQGSSFTVNDINLTHETNLVVSNEKIKEDNSNLILSFSPSSKGAYSYIITSPDGLITWEGKFNEVDGVYYSEPLLLTFSSSFTKGEYNYFITSEKGQEKSGSIELSYTLYKGPFFNEEGFVKRNDLLKITVIDGKITGFDSYSNPVVISKE